jgi:hypothetical protein
VRNRKLREPTAEELESLWKDVAGDDEAKAYRAFWRLTGSPKQAVPFLTRRLALAPNKGNVDQIRQLIRQLDDDSFAVREKASQQLAKQGMGRCSSGRGAGK